MDIFFSFGALFVDLRFLGGPLLSPLQRLSGPSPFFVALRGNLLPFLPVSDGPLPDPWQTPLESPPTP